MRLAGKVAIVTGGASGMGERMVHLFSQEGAQVIAADINEMGLEKIGKLDNVTGITLNVTSEDDWGNLLKEVKERFGRIDILINNAGISSEKRLEETTFDDWNKMMTINGFGPFIGLKHVFPYMKEQGSGAIVNISSYTAQIGQGLNPYTASKGAVRAFSKAAAVHFGSYGIRVNTIFPGIIETPMTQTLQASKDLLKQLEATTPLKRIGKPEDVANAVLFLASDEASFITGAELIVDGGFSAQ